MTDTARLLGRLAAPLRAWPAIALAATASSGGVAALAVAAWAARVGRVEGGAWVGVTWGMVLLAALAGGWGLRRLRHRTTAAAAARMLEGTGAWRQGALTSLLTRPAEGTSPDLLADADRRSAAALAERAPAILAPTVGRLRRRGLLALGLLAGVTLVLGAARPGRGRAALLWDPRGAWLAATAPIRVAGPDTAVDRGTRVRLALEAVGHRAATLWLRAPGEAWRPVPVTLDPAGRGSYETAPLEVGLFARLTAAGRGSDTIAVAVRPPAFLGAVTIEAHYPAYLHLDPEPLALDGDTIILPAGTRLLTTGEATAALAGARWVGPPGAAALTVDGPAFHGTTTPERSGVWTLDLATRSGAPLVGDTVRLPLRLVADSAPVVDLPVPGTDTVLPLTLQVPLVIEARDDHGLSRIVVSSRRVTAQGEAGAPRLDEVALPPGLPDHVVTPFPLDLNGRDLLPGDTVRVFVRAWDGAPVPHEGTSHEYAFRLARTDEVRTAAREASAAIGRQLDSAAAESRRLARSTQDLANERTRADASAGADGDHSLDYRSAQRAAEVARQQREMVAQADAVRQQLEQLQKAADQAGASDPEWQRQLDDIRKELDRALTPDLRQKLDQLDRALRDLDADRTRAALQDLAQAQQQLREALERSRELFRRAALEGDLRNLQAESRDLAAAQRQWNDQVPNADSARAAEDEGRLATRAESLSTALSRLGDQLRPEGREAAMDSAAAAARQAAGDMRQAAAQSARGARAAASQAGQQAAERLGQLPQQLQQQGDQLQQGWRQEVTAQLDAALQEMARLSAEQLDVSQGFQRGEAVSSLRQRQGAVEEGAERVLDQLRSASGKNALVSPQLGSNLALAQDRMRRAREALEPATPNFREGEEQAGAAVDALNAVSLQLMQSRGNVGNAQSGSGMQEAMAQMNALAQQQGGISQGAQSLIPMPGQGPPGAALQALAARQREVADQLERLRAGGQAPGAGELAAEARDLARRLESGRIDRGTAERQERLFHRMLDAGRTLQGQDADPDQERRSTTASGDSVHLPPALQARLGDAAGRLRMPTWDELQRFSPDERRLVIDYFRRLAQVPP